MITMLWNVHLELYGNGSGNTHTKLLNGVCWKYELWGDELWVKEDIQFYSNNLSIIWDFSNWQALLFY